MDFPTPYIILLHLFVAIVTTEVDGRCMTTSVNSTQVVKVKETAPEGTVLNSFIAEDGEEYDFHVALFHRSTPDRNNRLQKDYLYLNVVNHTYYLTLKKPLDLELLNLIMGEINNFTVYITCSPSSEEDKITETFISVEIEPVNEFAPVFFGSPYTVYVQEETVNGSIVFDLSAKVHDEDVDSLSALTFRLNKYMIREFDGSNVFSIPNKTSGNVILDKSVDYEEMKLSGMVFYMLNVTVVDSGGLYATTSINMTILDSDDQGPEFIYPGCESPCEELALELITHENYTGALQLEPASISACDRDAINNTIQYSLIPDADNFTSYFSINQDTADLFQTKPLTDTNTSYIELQIQAKEKSLKGYFIVANLTIIIEERGSMGTVSEDGEEDTRYTL